MLRHCRPYAVHRTRNSGIFHTFVTVLPFISGYVLPLTICRISKDWHHTLSFNTKLTNFMKRNSLLRAAATLNCLILSVVSGEGSAFAICRQSLTNTKTCISSFASTCLPWMVSLPFACISNGIEILANWMPLSLLVNNNYWKYYDCVYAL